MVHKMVDAKPPRPLRSPIVASAHLAEQSQELSELEYGIIVASAALAHSASSSESSNRRAGNCQYEFTVTVFARV